MLDIIERAALVTHLPFSTSVCPSVGRSALVLYPLHIFNITSAWFVYENYIFILH